MTAVTLPPSAAQGTNFTQVPHQLPQRGLVDMGEWSYSTGVQGPTLGENNLDTPKNLILASPLVDIDPENFRPETFTKAQNLLWSRSWLMTWLRPGSVKLVTVLLEIGKKKAAKTIKGR